MVPHSGTNWAVHSLIAQIGRDAMFSMSYGRGYKEAVLAFMYRDFPYCHRRQRKVGLVGEIARLYASQGAPCADAI